MAGPNVSVIMTVYNGEKYLEQAIDCIRQQTLKNFEFVIVDDGSDDRTPQILSDISRNDSRIRVISSSHIGRAKALNLVWKSAKGDYVANMDADDLVEPSRLEEQFLYFQQHPNTGLLGTRYKLLDETSHGTYIKHLPLNNNEIRKALIRHMQFFHSSMMIPRHVLENIGGYNEHLRVCIDYDICVRIASSYQVANLPQILVTQRINPSAFFQKIHGWQRYKTHVSIRWHAWRNFSGSINDLFYVINPIGDLDYGIRKLLRPIYQRYKRNFIINKL